MNYSFLLILLAVIATGCGGKKQPDGILPKDKMTAVMWDMMLADQYLSDNVFNKDTSLNRAAESVKLYQQVFYIHKTSKDEFYKSLAHYQSRPDDLRQLFDSLENWKPVSMRDTLSKAIRDTGSQLELKPELLKTN